MTRPRGLAALLAGRRPAGVYRCAADPGTWATGADEVRAAAGRAGWRLVVLDTATVADKAGLLEALLAVLQAPPHAGRNLDALWDVLRDLDAPTLLVWAAWGRLARADRRTFDAVTGLLAERAERGDLAVLLCGEGPAIRVPSLD